jgi:hypothetical protein
MKDHYVTGHARTRASQRGITRKDLELIIEFGTETESGFIWLERNSKALIQRLDKLRGVAAFVRGPAVTTVYRPTKRQRRGMEING